MELAISTSVPDSMHSELVMSTSVPDSMHSELVMPTSALDLMHLELLKLICGHSIDGANICSRKQKRIVIFYVWLVKGFGFSKMFSASKNVL